MAFRQLIKEGVPSGVELPPVGYVGIYVDTNGHTIARRSDGTEFDLAAASVVQNNYVFIQDVSDFPNPVAGVITLDATKFYKISGTVDIGNNRFAGTDCHIGGDNTDISSIVSSVPSVAMFTFSEQVNIRDVCLVSSGSGSSIFDISNTGVSTCILTSCIFKDSDSVGIIEDYNSIVLNFCGINNCKQGFTFGGSNRALAVIDCFAVNQVALATFWKILATASFSSRVLFSRCSFDTDVSSIALDVSASATIGTESYQIHDCYFAGTGTYTTGIDADDLRSDWEGNEGITSTKPSGVVHVIGDTTAIVIAAAGTAVKATYTGTTLANNRKFDDDSGVDNRLKFIGNGTIRAEAQISALILSSSASPKISLYVAINGLVQAETRVQVDTNTTILDPPLISLWIGDLSKDDYIEAWVANDDNTNNLVATNLHISVKEI